MPTAKASWAVTISCRELRSRRWGADSSKLDAKTRDLMMRLLMERGFAQWEASEKRCPRLVEWNEEEEKDIVYEALTERRCGN